MEEGLDPGTRMYIHEQRLEDLQDLQEISKARAMVKQVIRMKEHPQDCEFSRQLEEKWSKEYDE
jgi:hypothetical protein